MDLISLYNIHIAEDDWDAADQQNLFSSFGISTVVYHSNPIIRKEQELHEVRKRHLFAEWMIANSKLKRSDVPYLYKRINNE